MTMLLLVTFGVALIDWSAVFTQSPRTEAFAKPLVLVILISAIVQEGPTTTGWMVVAALAFSLIGDVFLLPAIDRFLAGLAAFLVSHLIYVVAFVSSWSLNDAQDRSQLFAGVSLAVALWFLIGRRIIAASEVDGSAMSMAVRAYIIVLSAMMIAGFGVGSTVLALGALLFALSDGVLGWNRFVAHLAHGRLATHVLYHLGQTLFALWAINLS
jgi:alkenylglycerophosphocholine/alkenylglycerophosphoethanolamine hydrolase